MNFKSTNDTIRISFMKKVKGGELGYIGQAVSMCYGKIDLAIDYRTEENRTYDLACSVHIPGDKDPLWVLMEEKVFYDFLQGSALARMTVFHEIGHIAFQDCLDPLKLEQRKKYVRDGTVSERKVRADQFAADFLGYSW